MILKLSLLCEGVIPAIDILLMVTESLNSGVNFLDLVKSF